MLRVTCLQRFCVLMLNPHFTLTLALLLSSLNVSFLERQLKFLFCL